MKVAILSTARRGPAKRGVDSQQLGVHSSVIVLSQHAGGSDLDVTRSHVEETLQASQITYLVPALEQHVVVSSGRLQRRGDGGGTERDIRQGDAEAGLDQTVFAEECRRGQRAVDLEERVCVPAVVQANLLAELSDLRPESSRQAHPIHVAFLDLDAAFLLLSTFLFWGAGNLEILLARDEDLGAGVGIERRLEGELELPWSPARVVGRAAGCDVAADYVAGNADFRVEYLKIAGAAYL